jgi:GNAT superfamily N-acetyltransferase
VRAVGLARAEAYERQVAALGQNATALVNAVEALSKSNVPFMPNTLVMGGGDGNGSLGGLMALLMRQIDSGLASRKELPASQEWSRSADWWKKIFLRLLAFSSEAGWNQTAGDWQLMVDLYSETCFGMDFDGQLVATTTLACYGERLAWLGMVLTKREFQRRGFARSLVEHALSIADSKRILTVKLDATTQGQPLYERLGFVVEQMVGRRTESPKPFRRRTWSVEAVPRL